MKRRNFLTMIGAATLAPALPAFGGPVSVAAGSYNRYQFGFAVFHARSRTKVSAAGIANRLKVSLPQAEAMISEIINSDFVKPDLGGSRIKAISTISKPDFLGFERADRQAKAGAQTVTPHIQSPSERTTP